MHKAFALLTQAQEVMRRSNPGNEGVAEPHLAALIRRNVLKLGMALNCSKCSHKSWFSLEDLSSEMPCPRCFGEFPFPAGSPPSRDAWAYRVIGPFATAGFAQGAYCVASSLHFLANKIAFQSSWLPSFEMVKGGIRELEADFGIFVAPGAISHISTPYLIFGECKSFNNFEEKDFARARKTAQMYRGAVLCFSTFRDSLDRDEIVAIKQIAEAGRDPLDAGRQLNPVLILTARELFGQFRHVDFNSLYGDKAQYARGISSFGGKSTNCAILRSNCILACRHVMTPSTRSGESGLRKQPRGRQRRPPPSSCAWRHRGELRRSTCIGPIV